MFADTSPSFLYPAFFCFLPLPMIVSAFVRAQNYEKPLILPLFNDFQNIKYKAFAMVKPPLRVHHFLLWASWAFLLVALARPQYLQKVSDIKVTGRDLLLVVDMSGSMARPDMKDEKGVKITRFTALKKVVGEFLQRRLGDRVGLAVFGSTAHLYSPLTFDAGAVATMLSELEISMIDLSTAIGDGIVVGAKHLAAQTNEAENKVIILLTDGQNNAGVYDPEDAARLARTMGIKIYTIGFVGEDKDAVDEASLIRIAYGTGGQYYRATNRQQLENIYAEIDQLEPSFSASDSFVYTDIFHIPLLLSLLCLVIGVGRHALRI